VMHRCASQSVGLWCNTKYELLRTYRRLAHTIESDRSLENTYTHDRSNNGLSSFDYLLALLQAAPKHLASLARMRQEAVCIIHPCRIALANLQYFKSPRGSSLHVSFLTPARLPKNLGSLAGRFTIRTKKAQKSAVNRQRDAMVEPCHMEPTS
jgi:hypothetical protein